MVGCILDLALSPTSTHTSTEHSESRTFSAEPDLKALPAQSPAYNPSIECMLLNTVNRSCKLNIFASCFDRLIFLFLAHNGHKLNKTSNVLKNHHFAPKPYHQLPPGQFSNY